jgi:hypothetical protein
VGVAIGGVGPEHIVLTLEESDRRVVNVGEVPLIVVSPRRYVYIVVGICRDRERGRAGASAVIGRGVVVLVARGERESESCREGEP